MYISLKISFYYDDLSKVFLCLQDLDLAWKQRWRKTLERIIIKAEGRYEICRVVRVNEYENALSERAIKKSKSTVNDANEMQWQCWWCGISRGSEASIEFYSFFMVRLQCSHPWELLPCSNVRAFFCFVLQSDFIPN